jgi:hypothetical protein
MPMNEINEVRKKYADVFTRLSKNQQQDWNAIFPFASKLVNDWK